jgi:hypothetical protein
VKQSVNPLADFLVRHTLTAIGRSVDVKRSRPWPPAGHPAPDPIPLRFRGKDGLTLLDQMRALDRQRLVRRRGIVTARRSA